MLHTRTVSSPEKVHQYTGYIKQAAEHLLELINGILDVSKIQAGKLAVEKDGLASALRWLVNLLDAFNTEADAPFCSQPTLVVHAAKDEVVPVSHGRRCDGCESCKYFSVRG